MTRCNDGEVAAVERRDLRLGERLTRDDDGGIDEAKVKRFVRLLQLGGALQLMLVKVVQAVGATDDILDEGLPRSRTVELVQPVVDFDEDRRWDHEVLAGLLDGPHTASMLGIGRVEQRDDRTRVEDERHLRAAAAARRRILVGRDRLRRATIPGHDPEARPGAAAQPAGLALDRLAQHVSEGNAAAARLALQHGQVVALGGDGGSPGSHASDASIVALGSPGGVNLLNGARSCNVFWQVGSSATLAMPTLRRSRGAVKPRALDTRQSGSTSRAMTGSWCVDDWYVA